MARAKRTIDQDEIRRWAEERGGRPATVTRTGSPGDPGILRIDFPGFSGEATLEEIAWDDWFRAFEENGLAFLYSDDRESRFNKLVSRTASEDEQEIRVPDRGRSRRWSSKTSRVTINDATAEELDGIWGVGPELARRIVAHRRKAGPIRGEEDLVAIDGIDGATANLIAREAEFE